MEVTQAILNVLAIIALIAAVAFILILLVDLVLSITNRKGSIFFRNKNGDKNSERPVVKDAEESYDRPTVLDNQQTTEQPKQTWDEEAARREQMELLNKKSTFDEEEELRLAKERDLENERQQSIERRKQEFDDFDDFDSLFEDEPKSEPTPVSTEPEFNFDDMINEINSESVTQYEASQPVEFTESVEPEVVEEPQTKSAEDFVMPDFDTTETSAETTETNNETTETTETVNQAIVPVETVVTTQEEQETSNEDADSQEIIPVVEPKKEIINVYEYFPIDALEERLAKLQERLKINERDLRGNRKEYNPLARVQRNLKRDQEKLRRREAIVARKKVMLYGVNNYVDIDEEKAKKLSEDLDLLDGLRLSVQHCEEVMEQNKDRFPILEKTNQILVEQNKQINDDIAEVKAAIERLKKEIN